MCESPVICDLALFTITNGLFGIIKQICHASVGNMMECLPSGGWFSLGLRPRENHPPSGKHSVMLPTLAWHICILWYMCVAVRSRGPLGAEMELGYCDTYCVTQGGLEGHTFTLCFHSQPYQHPSLMPLPPTPYTSHPALNPLLPLPAVSTSLPHASPTHTLHLTPSS